MTINEMIKKSEKMFTELIEKDKKLKELEKEMNILDKEYHELKQEISNEEYDKKENEKKERQLEIKEKLKVGLKFRIKRSETYSDNGRWVVTKITNKMVYCDSTAYGNPKRFKKVVLEGLARVNYLKITEEED